MNLVIVESPTKAKTITKFLGKGYKIESSFGHIRDLPKSKMGVDTENNFEPEYTIPDKAKKNLTKLKELAKKAPLHEVVLNMTIEHHPNPVDAQKYRIPQTTQASPKAIMT